MSEAAQEAIWGPEGLYERLASEATDEVLGEVTVDGETIVMAAGENEEYFIAERVKE